VLRNIDREGNDTLKETSFLDNIEPWLVEEWKSAYGDARAQIIAESAMDRSPIYLTTKSLPGSKLDNSPIMKAFQTSFTEEEYVEVLPQGSIRIPDSYGGDIASWPLYDDGEWWIQDPSATIPAMALYHGFVSDGFKLSDLHVLDLCSAPGGKTMQLGSYGFNHVTAVELSQRRAKQLKSNLNRVKMQDHCTVIVADGSRFRSDDGKLFDGILVDAPCSATGLGSRRPDVLRRSCDINELTSIQRKLAVHAFDNLLKPGGIMVYATCSLLKEESEDQMKWLLDSRAENIKSLPFTNREIPGFDGAIDENGWMRVLPGVLHKPMDKCDGFFVARIRKKS
jgi:16S rRNA (cytosine967-C5)-methyltransferase